MAGGGTGAQIGEAMIPVAGRVLILAPHPDDEIAACAIATRSARAAGARVFVLHLTTGVPPAASLWRWERAAYMERVWRRQEEALAAARLLGIEIVGFRETAARRLRFDLDAASSDIAATIARCRADAVWVPAFEGAHQDHDAANALAACAAGSVPVWEFAEYNYAGGRVRSNRFASERGGEVMIAATPAEAELKQAALACYESERRNLSHIVADREACRPLQPYDYGKRPHPGRLFRERFHWVPFRHPGVDFDASADVYRDLEEWISARQLYSTAPLDNPPRGQSRQTDREFAGAFDKAERQRGVG
jgi:LmbE family N-acetylglucosaminyl deacetylase